VWKLVQLLVLKLKDTVQLLLQKYSVSVRYTTLRVTKGAMVVVVVRVPGTVVVLVVVPADVVVLVVVGGF
jgi:hypothetical protein